MKLIRRRYLLRNLIFSLSPLLFSVPSMAYRGQNATVQDAPVSTPGTGIPGYLDAQVAPKGMTIFELPTMSVDYGVTDRLTLGTNLLPLGLMLYTKSPSLSLKARYLFYSNQNVASSITLYGGGFWDSAAGINYLGGTTNTTYFFSKYSQLTFHLGAFRLMQQSSLVEASPSNGISSSMAERLSSSISGFAVLPGLSFQHFFNDSFGLQADLLYVASLKEDLNKPGTISFKNHFQGSMAFPWRALLNFKTSEMALLSVGAMGFYNIGPANNNFFVLPTISFTWLTND